MARGRGGTLLAWASVGVAAFLSACYSPKVISGGLKCAQSSSKVCPDGFVCVQEMCLAIGAQAGSGAGGSGGFDGEATGGSGAGGSVLGTGGLDGSGGTTSGTGGNRPPTRTVGQSCLISRPGDGTTTDDCVTGLVCVEDCGSAAGARCYRYCEADADCPESACSRLATAGGRKICEVPFTACDPVDGHVGCSLSTQACYLLAPLASGDKVASVCDCSLNALTVGEPCSDSRECAPGLLCPPPGSGLGATYCRRACDPRDGETACSSGACRPLGSRWGYCF